MPAPTSSQLEGIAKGAMAGAGLRGENAPDLGAALGQASAQALTIFVAKAQVLPGIPAVAPPPALSGSTVGPGNLLPPPAGGPGDGDIEPLCKAALAANSIRGEAKDRLAKALAQSIAQAILLYTSMVKVAPGIAIAGGTSASPGNFLGAPPPKPMLEPIVLGFLSAGDLRGANAKDLASAVAESLATALTQFMSMVKIAPGVGSSPGATAAPGRLL